MRTRYALALLALLSLAPLRAEAQESEVDPAVIYSVSYVLTGFGAALTVGGLYDFGDGSADILAYSTLLYGASELVVLAAVLSSDGARPREVALEAVVATAVNFAGIGAALAGLLLLPRARARDPEAASAELRIAPGGLAVAGAF